MSAAARGIDVAALLERHTVRLELAERFARSYRNYCWPVESLRDIRIAPFHAMATEGAVHTDKDHVWHMSTISSFVQEGDGLLMRTPYQVVEFAIPSRERPPLFFTPEERRAFRRSLRPDGRLRIWIAHYRHGWHPAHAQLQLHHLTRRDAARQAFDLKVCTMTAGSTAMQLIGVRSASSGELVRAAEIEIEIEMQGKACDALVEIWPPKSAEVRWPPAAAMTHQDIEDWTNMWGKAPGAG